MKENFEHHLNKMLTSGFTSIFTSLHIPEDDPAYYSERLRQLGTWAREKEVSIYADVSGNALEKMGFSFRQAEELKELGLTGLRMDYGVELTQIAELSNQMKVALNASTLTPKELSELKKAGASFENLIAWHNYYPRPETGLSKDTFIRTNKWLKEEGFTVAAFVPGDGERRGPLYQELPTLEKHRNVHPLAGAIELQRDC